MLQALVWFVFFVVATAVMMVSYVEGCKRVGGILFVCYLSAILTFLWLLYEAEVLLTPYAIGVK